MPKIPAVCSQCGKSFSSPIKVAENPEASARLINNTVGPCPHCGGSGRIPDGWYMCIGTTLAWVRQTNATREQLLRIRQSLTDLLQRKATPSEIHNTIERDAPGLLKIFANQTNRFEVYAIIGLLIAVLGYVDSRTPDRGHAPDVDANEVIEGVTRGVDREGDKEHAGNLSEEPRVVREKRNKPQSRAQLDTKKSQAKKTKKARKAKKRQRKQGRQSR